MKSRRPSLVLLLATHVSAAAWIVPSHQRGVVVVHRASSTEGLLGRPNDGCPRRSLSPWRLSAAAKKGFGGGSGATSSKNKKKKKKSGGGGFGSPPAKAASSTASKASQQQQILKQVQQTYGGTSPQQIAAATQRRIDQELHAQPPHLQLALALYRNLQEYQSHLSTLSLLEQAQLPLEQTEGAQRARDELDRLCAQHDDVSEHALHTLYHRMTWDASATAKAASALLKTMPANLQRHVDTACGIVAAAADAAAGETGLILDVGCGHGTLVPSLVRAGLQERQIHGVDLSPEMIRLARQYHSSACTFEAADFYHYTPKTTFAAVLFCASLHDLPDPRAALYKAIELTTAVTTNNNNNNDNAGTSDSSSSSPPVSPVIVVSHPQGGGHVLQQVRSNPVLVRRGLPTADEYRQWLSELNDDNNSDDGGWELVREPAPSGSAVDQREGYLAVLAPRQRSSV